MTNADWSGETRSKILEYVNILWPEGGDEAVAFINGSSTTLDLVDEFYNLS